MEWVCQMRKIRLDQAESEIASRLGIAPAEWIKVRNQLTPREPKELSPGSFPRFALAARRVGGLDRQSRFAWLVRFAQLPPEDLQEPGLVEVREEIASFSALEGLRASLRTALTQDQIINLREQVHIALNSLASPGGEWIPPNDSSQLRLRRTDQGVQATYEGTDFAANFILAAARLLQHEGSRLARCARPNCERFFVRHKAGEYCSPYCSMKVRNDRRRPPKSKRSGKKVKQHATTNTRTR